MSNVAIVLGNALYQSGNLDDLPCCKEDVDAVRTLLEATGKYDTISAHIDLDGDGMKEAIRDAIAQHDDIGEVFFYFSGHGAQKKSEFYFCGTAFDNRKPNESGLSTAELHSLLRSGDPTLVVKVIDACHSGRALIKSEEAFERVTKGDLGNFIQIASCLDSQFSLTSDPLSKFTQSFCAATLRKEEGAILYSDIVNSLRDIYLADDEQTPHFISQGIYWSKKEATASLDFKFNERDVRRRIRSGHHSRAKLFASAHSNEGSISAKIQISRPAYAYPDMCA